MKPNLPPYDVAYRGLADAEHRGEMSAVVCAFSVKAANFSDIGLSQDGIAILLASERNFRTRCPTFSDHISCVVSGRSDEQMRRSDARAVVTFMADDQVGGNRPSMQFPGKAMGRDISASDHQSAVAFVVCGLEVPASGRLLNIAPEPFLGCFPPVGDETGACTKSTAGGQYIRRYPKFRAADFTISSDAADLTFIHPGTIPCGWILRNGQVVTA